MNLATIAEPHDGGRPALVTAAGIVTYGELRAAAAALRGGLIGQGLSAGDRVALVCANGPEFVAAYLAVLGAGGIAVPLNPASPPAELTRHLSRVGARAALVGPGAGTAFARLDRAALGHLELVATDDAGVGDLAWADLAVGPPAAVVDVAADHPAVLLYTSGTAGHPQAAILSHGNLTANIEQVLGRGDPVGPTDVVLGVLPLFHVFGLNVVLGVSLAVGASVVLLPRFEPASALAAVAEQGVTVVVAPPPVWQAWSGLAPDGPSPFAGVQLCLTGAAKMPEEATRELTTRFGVTLHEGYGLTECSPVVTSSVGGPAKTGSIGQALPGVELRLVDGEGQPALVGDPGEIWVRGPNVFHGYWGDPESTAQVLSTSGWLRTGDIAVVDDDGDLFLVDRAKDLVIVSGFNVYPAEVEEVIAELDGVAEAAVVGIPDERTGEAVKAYVVPRPGASLEPEAVVAWCEERLARYKCPSEVIVVAELPRGPAGKVLRRILR